MNLLYRWLGAEIVFIHVGRGLLGLGVAMLVAPNILWWFAITLTPLAAFSIWFWLQEAKFVLPVARRYLSGDPERTTATATTPPRLPQAGRGDPH